MASVRNSLRAVSLQSGAIAVSSRYSRIVVRSCNRVVMDSTVAIMTSESNDFNAFCYLFEISTARQLTMSDRECSDTDPLSFRGLQVRLLAQSDTCLVPGCSGSHPLRLDLLSATG